MQIIKDKKPGDVIDFTTKEPVYYNSRTKKNKVQKFICPTCGRRGRIMRDGKLLVHQLTVRLTGPDLWDACETADMSTPPVEI